MPFIGHVLNPPHCTQVADIHRNNHVGIRGGDKLYGYRQLVRSPDIEIDVVTNRGAGRSAVPVKVLVVLGLCCGHAVDIRQRLIFAGQIARNSNRVAVAIRIADVPSIDLAIIVLVEDPEEEVV